MMRKTTVADLLIEIDRFIWQVFDALPLWKGLQRLDVESKAQE